MLGCGQHVEGRYQGLGLGQALLQHMQQSCAEGFGLFVAEPGAAVHQVQARGACVGVAAQMDAQG